MISKKRFYSIALVSTIMILMLGGIVGAALPIPVDNWNAPADIAYGTPLSSTQLDATATDPTTGNPVDGTFAYTPPAGTILGAGTQTLSATFTPTDSINYTTATKTVSINVKVCEENNGGDFGPNYGGCGYGGCAGAFVPVPMMGPGYGSGPYGYGSEPYGYSSEPSATTEVQTSCKDKACFNKHKHKIHSKHHNTAKHHSKHHKAKNC